MRNKVFKPRYLFEGERAIGLAGIRENDWHAIIELANENIVKKLPDDLKSIVTGFEEYQSEKALTINKLKEMVEIKYGHAVLKFTKKLSAPDVNSIMVCASLQWFTRYCNDHRLHLVTDPDVLRIYRTLEFLSRRLDEPRQEWIKTYSWFDGPTRGQFACLMQMDDDHRAVRVRETKKRIEENKKLNEFVLSMLNQSK